MLSATCAAEEGTEALLSYASQGNAAFLTMYGFVPERNPFAAMELFGDVREAAAWAVNAFPPPVCPMSMPRSGVYLKSSSLPKRVWANAGRCRAAQGVCQGSDRACSQGLPEDGAQRAARVDAAVAAALAQGADSTAASAEHAAEEPFAAADRQRLVVRAALEPRGIHIMKQTLAKISRMLVLPSVTCFWLAARVQPLRGDCLNSLCPAQQLLLFCTAPRADALSHVWPGGGREPRRLPPDGLAADAGSRGEHRPRALRPRRNPERHGCRQQRRGHACRSRN